MRCPFIESIDLRKGTALHGEMIAKSESRKITVEPSSQRDNMDYMDLTGYELEWLRDDEDFSLYRARQPGNPVSVLTLVAARPASRSITRLEHEYELAALLDSRWAAQPLALSRHNALPTLVLDDNGYEPLDRALGQRAH